MNDVDEVRDYADNLDSLGDALDRLVILLKIVDVVKGVQTILDQPRTTEESLETLNDVFNAVQIALKVVSKAPLPIGTLATALDQALKPIKKSVLKIEEKAEDVANKVEKTYTQQFKELISEHITLLLQFSAQGAAIGLDLHNRSDAINKFADVTERIGSPVDDLVSRAARQAQPANDAVQDVRDDYDVIVGKIENAKAVFEDKLFGPIARAAEDLKEFVEAMEFLEGPMSVVRQILEPIQPILNAIGFIFDLVVAPAIDFLTKTLKIDQLLESVTDQITKLLPSVDVFDPLLDILDSLKVQFDQLGVIGDRIETLYQTLKNSVVSPFETSDLEAVVLGTGRSDQITADARGSYIDALLGNDTVMGGAGSDILAATPGNDTLTGGAGRDYAVFTGDFSDFLFHVVTSGSVNTLIINHDTVASGDQDLGSESITEIERLIFDDIIVRTSDLINNVFRGSGIVNGTNGNDFLFATLSATINGFLGNDRLTGSQQNDTLNGGGGNDVLLKSEGQDEINGGNGVDTLIFANNSGANSNIIVDLRTGSSFDGSSGNTDVLNSVESIVVQAPRGSKLYGNAEANSLSGNLGKDTIVGRGGDDLLRGDAERDILIGGNGVDTILGGSGGDILLVSDRPRRNVGQTYDGGIGFDAIVYTHDIQHYFTSIGAQLPPDLFDDELSKSGPVIINVRRGEVQRMSQNGETVLAVDTLTDIEAFVGSAFKDTLIGGFAVDEDGNQLSQSINGSAGADLLYTRSIRWSDGGDGNDTVVALIQTEEEHSQSFDGGSGFDVLQLDKIAGARTAIGGPGGQRIQVFRADDLQSLGSGSTTATSRESLLFSGSVEGFEEIILGSADDEITFTPLGSTRIVVRGGDGNDLMTQGSNPNISSDTRYYGEDGEDYLKLVGGGRLLGGRKADTLEVDSASSSIRVDGGGGDDLVRIERAEGGAFNGGAGYDTFSIDTSNAVNLDLQNKIIAATGAGKDIEGRVENFESFIGSNISSDTIIGRHDAAERMAGRGGNDSLVGNGGNDVIFGGEGNDTLRGGFGRDTVSGGPGSDLIFGGAGVDFLSYAPTQPGGEDGSTVALGFSAVDVNLNTGRAISNDGTDTLDGIENVIGGVGNDKITGDGGRNVLMGAAGNDTLYGLGGDDVLLMGKDRDVVYANGGDDTVVIGPGWGRAFGGAGRDTLNLGSTATRASIDFSKNQVITRHLEQVPVWTDTGTGEARAWQGQQYRPRDIWEADPEFANNGGDTTRSTPPPRADRFQVTFEDRAEFHRTDIDGFERYESNGSTTVIVASSARDWFNGSVGDRDFLDLRSLGAVNYDMASKATNAAPLRGDQMSGLDGLLGSNRRNEFRGTDGDDFLNGNGGNDLLIGRSGSDELNGGNGKDTLQGGDGRDKLNGERGADLLLGGNNADTLNGGAGVDTMSGGNGNDVLIVDHRSDVARGGAGVDEVRSGQISLNLANYDGIDNGALFGSKNLSLRADNTGSQSNDLSGNDGNNTILGFQGRDILRGEDGNDSLGGGAGNDTIVGGFGRDTLVGGNGRDEFRFSAPGESRPGASERDVIEGFGPGLRQREDVINLRAIDATPATNRDDRFTSIGDDAFNGVAGELRYQVVGRNTLIQADLDGDGSAEMEILVRGFTNPTDNMFIL